MALVEVDVFVLASTRGRRAPALRIVRDDDALRFPKTRGECIDGPRPCPWARCRHHTHVDLSAAKDSPSLLVNEDREETCSLDVADRAGPDGLTQDEVATAMHLTRERIRQLEEQALKHGRRIAQRMGMETFYPGNEGR